MRLSVGELVVAVAVLSVVLVGGCTSGQPVSSDAVGAVDSASPTATSSIAVGGVAGSPLAHGPVRVLPPFCGVPEVVATLPEPYNDFTGECPRTLPPGSYLGVLVGVHLLRLARLEIPEEGWTARPFGSFSGFELTGPRGGGVAVFAYPVLAGTRGDSLSGEQVYRALKARDDVTVVDSGPSKIGGWPGTWMDLTPDGGALTTDDCRRTAPCLPLLAPMRQPDIVELRPGSVSRLFVEEGNESQVRAAVWIHDINAPDAPAALKITSSLVLDAAFEPRPPTG